MSLIESRLFQLRRHLGLSQEEMAKKIRRSTRGWQTYERGEKMPGGDVFYFLAQIGVNIHWLVTGRGEMMVTDQPELIISDMQDSFDIPNDSEAQELMHMSVDQFWELFEEYGQLNPVQCGWTQMEIIRRFPEFRRWLKIKREEVASKSPVRKKTA